MVYLKLLYFIIGDINGYMNLVSIMDFLKIFLVIYFLFVENIQKKKYFNFGKSCYIIIIQKKNIKFMRIKYFRFNLCVFFYYIDGIDKYLYFINIIR